MKQSILCILFVLMGMSASAADFPDVAGWKPEGGAKTYDSESLWEYINGAAELFLAYGFQELRVRDLGSGELVMTVSIYDQGTSLNAYGVFDTESPDDATRFAIGGGAVVLAPYQALMIKDRRSTCTCLKIANPCTR